MKYDYTLTPNKNRYINYNIKDDYSPKISIITASYNTKEYIFETADSVLHQTYPWFEWIIVDDGSKDKKSIEILEKLTKKDKRIKVYTKKNGGASAARNYGCKMASKTSEYYIFLDDDDLLETNYVECTYFALENNPDAAFAYTNSVGFGEIEYLWDKKFDIEKQMKENMLVLTALIRKETFDPVGGFDEEDNNICEDWIFWSKLFSYGGIPVKVNYTGFWYRRKKDGKLNKDLENRNRLNEIINKLAKEVDYRLKAIEYPKNNYDWDKVCRNNYNFECVTETKPDKKNILMIVPHVVMGGADKFNIDFLKGLDREKYTITIIITNISNNEWLQEVIKYVDSYYILPSFLDRENWNYFLEFLIRKNKTELIFNTNSVYGYMCLPYLKSKFKEIRILDYIHMEEWYNRNGGYSRDSSSFESIIDLTLTCNESSTQILKDYFGRNKDEVKTCYIGVDEEKFKNTYNIDKLKEKYDIPKNRKIISYICRITYQKRPFLLLEIMKMAIKKRKDILFLICGDGELEDELKLQVRDSGLNKFVKFLGRIKETEEIYAISDMTINCSIKEGLALTAYESLSMGVPVVTSNVGGQKELIDKTVGKVIDTKQKEEDVLIFKYDDEEINTFVNSVDEVLNNLEYYKKNCRKRILSGFTIKQMNINMNNYIDMLINKKTKKEYNHEDIAKELLNQYLLTTNEEYNYFIKKNNEKYSDDLNKRKEDDFNTKLIKWSIKYHIYYEIKNIRNIFKSFKELLINIIELPIRLILRLLRFLYKLLSKLVRG